MRYIFLFIMLLTILASCEDEGIGSSKNRIWVSEDVILGSERNSTAVINMSSSNDWQAMSTASWLSLSQRSGRAGSFKIRLIARSTNNTAEERKAFVVIGSGLARDTVRVVQEPAEYVKLDNSYFLVDSKGSTFNISYETNVEKGIMVVSQTNWLSVGPVPASNKGSFKITIEPNEDSQQRIATVYLIKSSDKSKNVLRNALKMITIVQVAKGAPSTEYTSTDYSADGLTRTIQQSTKGRGIPIVIMGDGFVDRDIAEGKFDQAVDVAVENLFTEEPIKSLRDYFDIYAITAVSANASFSSQSKTAFSCKFEGTASTGISGSESAVTKYIKKIDGVKCEDVLAVVIINSITYAGTTSLGYTDKDGNLVDFAIAYCPTIDSLHSESFRQVLCHEAIGHGFAKLEDEYYYESYGNVTDDLLEQLEILQQNKFCLNVDTERDSSKVLWADFITDANYILENIGVYEGACTYPKGIYRPSLNSMMRNNDAPFNAPSRRSIYNFVMTRSGRLTPTYEEFVEFDMQHYPNFNTLKSATTSPTLKFASPKFVNRMVK